MGEQGPPLREVPLRALLDDVVRQLAVSRPLEMERDLERRAGGEPVTAEREARWLASAVLDRAPEALRDAAIAFLAEVDAAVATASGTRRVGRAAPGPPLAADCRHR